MAVASRVEELWHSLHGLRDSLRQLQLAAVEDRPRHSDLLPVEALGESVEDLLGVVHQSVMAAAAALVGPGAEPVPWKLRQGLAQIQDQVDEAALRIGFDLGSHQRLADLDELAGDRGGEWRAWTASVHQALEHCQPPLRATQRALLACWLELTQPGAAATRPPTPSTHAEDA